MSGHGLRALGTVAPDFTAESSTGGEVRLADLRGSFVILVFYPGDNTPTCTAQLCAFRENGERLTERGVRVLGINPAGVARHQAFSKRRNFPFALLSDAGSKIAESYGARGLFGLTRRSVFIISPAGVVVFARHGRPSPEELLKRIEALSGEESGSEPPK